MHKAFRAIGQDLVLVFGGRASTQGVVLGAVLSVASTMVLTRLLIDQGQLRTTAGRIMVAIALVEDLAVVIFVSMGLLVNPRELFSHVTILAVMIGLMVLGCPLVRNIAHEPGRYSVRSLSGSGSSRIGLVHCIPV